jgi:hypothetical protein
MINVDALASFHVVQLSEDCFDISNMKYLWFKEVNSSTNEKRLVYNNNNAARDFKGFYAAIPTMFKTTTQSGYGLNTVGFIHAIVQRVACLLNDKRESFQRKGQELFQSLQMVVAELRTANSSGAAGNANSGTGGTATNGNGVQINNPSDNTRGNTNSNDPLTAKISGKRFKTSWVVKGSRPGPVKWKHPKQNKKSFLLKQKELKDVQKYNDRMAQLRRQFVRNALELCGKKKESIAKWDEQKMQNVFAEFTYQMFRSRVNAKRGERTKISMIQVLKQVAWRLESKLRLGQELLQRYNRQLFTLFNDPLRCAEEFILCGDTRSGWQKRRNLRFPHRKSCPRSYIPKYNKIDGIMMKSPTTMASYDQVLKGFEMMDKTIPFYDNIKFQKKHQYGKTLSKEGYEGIISETINSKHIDKKSKVYDVSFDDWHQWFSTEITKNPAVADTLAKASIRLGNNRVRLTSTLLTYLLSGDGFKDLPWAKTPERKQKILVLMTSLDFKDPKRMEQLDNIHLLSYGEAVEDMESVRTYCSEPFAYFDSWQNPLPKIWVDPVSGQPHLLSLDMQFVADLPFMCKILGMNFSSDTCWKCKKPHHSVSDNSETENSQKKHTHYYDIGEKRSIESLVLDAANPLVKEQVLPPLSTKFSLDNYHTDPLHFSSATGRGLCEHLVESAMHKDRCDLAERVKLHPVFRHFNSDSSDIIEADEYIQFIELLEQKEFNGNKSRISSLHNRSKLLYGNFIKNKEKIIGPIVSQTLINIQNLFDRLSVGVDLIKEKTGTNDFNVQGDSLLLILELMPEICKNHLQQQDVSKYTNLKKLHHIIHKYTLTEADKSGFKDAYRKAFDSLSNMESKCYLHIGYHYCEEIEKGIAVGMFNCQKQERTNRVAKLGVQDHSNKRVPSIAEEIHELAMESTQAQHEETNANDKRKVNLGKHYVDQFVTWYNRRRVTTRKYYDGEQCGKKRKRMDDDDSTSNKKLRTMRKRISVLQYQIAFQDDEDDQSQYPPVPTVLTPIIPETTHSVPDQDEEEDEHEDDIRMGDPDYLEESDDEDMDENFQEIEQRSVNFQ